MTKEVLELLKKANKVAVAHRKPSPPADAHIENEKNKKKLDVIHKSLKKLKEQIDHVDPVDLSLVLERLTNTLKSLDEQIERVDPVDLSPVLQRLNDLEGQISILNKHWRKRAEIYDLQISIMRKFDAILSKEQNR